MLCCLSRWGHFDGFDLMHATQHDSRSQQVINTCRAYGGRHYQHSGPWPNDLASHSALSVLVCPQNTISSSTAKAEDWHCCVIEVKGSGKRIWPIKSTHICKEVNKNNTASSLLLNLCFPYSNSFSFWSCFVLSAFMSPLAWVSITNKVLY